MKLATLRDGSRDGQLVVVKRDNRLFCRARHIAANLQTALDHWPTLEAPLRQLGERLEVGDAKTEAVDFAQFQSPLPRAYEWVDGSAYINHIVLVRKARGAEPPATLQTDPLVYQGGSGVFLDPTGDLPLVDADWGLDYESEIAVVLGDTPQGVRSEDAHRYIRLIMLANDVTLRNLIPAELAKGFGFFNAKPATAFAPLALTPDALGPAWRDGRVHLRLRSMLNGQLAGDPEAGPEMHFSFFDLIAHITKTRGFTAGTILGSGTVSNEDTARGVSCLAERRMLETIATGAPKTPFMKVGDQIAIEMLNNSGENLFGSIRQKVVPA